MKTPWPGSNSAIFVLFFGLAVIEALQSGPWWRLLFWVAVGVVFLLADLHANAQSASIRREHRPGKNS
jgi:hypothetical protein